MEQLNYHHLLYFWVVAREGTIARACERLHLAQPTISAQLRSLERALGERLFRRAGRGLELTEAGLGVFYYADQIFSLGRELVGFVKGSTVGQATRLVVGVAQVVPKLIAYRLLQPALRISTPINIVCREHDLAVLLGDLALHRVDVVISDSPATPGANIRAYNHLLGECGVTFFGAKRLAQRLRPKFPRSLSGAPMLLPTQSTVLRRSLASWFEANHLEPHVQGEFDDSALMKVFGQAGLGVFPGPSAIESEIRRQYGVQVVGRIDQVRERFYAITVERRLKHPAEIAISEAARERLFVGG